MTKLNPNVPDAQRGTLTGPVHPWVLDYLTSLGVTAVELLPVQQFIDDRYVVSQGRTNYWGYMQIGYLAPHNAYAATGTLTDGAGVATNWTAPLRWQDGNSSICTTSDRRISNAPGKCT